MSNLKPLAGCPLCASELSVETTNTHGPSFTQRWMLSVSMVCRNCHCRVSATTEHSDKAPAVVEFLQSRERELKRHRDIRDLSAKIVELVKSDPFDAVALQEARATLLELTRET